MTRVFLYALVVFLAIALPVMGGPADPPDCENDWEDYPLWQIPLIEEETCNCTGEISEEDGVSSGNEYLACPAGWQPGDTWGDYWPTAIPTGTMTPTMTPTPTATSTALPTLTPTVTPVPAIPSHHFYMPIVHCDGAFWCF